MIKFDNLLIYCIDNDVTIEELIVLYYIWGLFYSWDSLSEKYNNLAKMYSNKFNKKLANEDIKQSLIKKGLIVIKDNMPELTNKSEKMFISLFGVDTFISNYPSFVVINNKNIPLKTTNLMELKKAYCERVVTVEQHKEILLDIKFGKTNNMLNMSIVNFIESEFWNSIREIRLEKVVSSSNIVSNSIEDE